MKKIMKRIILICIACIVLLLFVARVALYSISYHEKNDYREILSISYSGTEIWSGEETRIVCESEEETVSYTHLDVYKRQSIYC